MVMLEQEEEANQELKPRDEQGILSQLNKYMLITFLISFAIGVSIGLIFIMIFLKCKRV